MKTSKLSTNPADFQTRGVLSGAYGKRTPTDRSLLTHLVFVPAENAMAGEEFTALCRTVKPGNMADQYSNPEGNSARPTCPKCAPKWDRLHSA